jgi:trk system potassium uptake protein TrkA
MGCSWKLSRRDWIDERYTLYAIILGCGTTGIKVAEWLMASGAEVTLIEEIAEKQRLADNLLGSVVVLGDGTKIATQDIAGVKRSNLFISTLSSDEDNMLACQIAKHHFEVDRTIAISDTPDNANLLKLLGIDIVIDVTELITEKMQSLVAPMLVEDL